MIKTLSLKACPRMYLSGVLQGKAQTLLSQFNPLIIILSLFLFSCSSTKEIRKPPELKVTELTISKGIDRGLIANPINPTTAFITQDTETIAHLKIENMHGRHTIRWDWYGTDGKVQYTSGDYQVNISKNKFHKQFTAWHSLPIKGEKAETLPGEWQVKVYFDGQLHTSKSFNIEYADIDIEKLPQTAQVYPSRWGLIIGIETYANLPPVDYAKKDAALVRDYFIKILGIPQENIIFLSGEKATKSAIAGNIKEHLPKNLEKDSSLYIYFTGHGAPDVDTGDAYLIPYDGDMRYITESGYKLEDFYQDISNLDINMTYVFLDSCFSGVSRGEKMLLAGAKPTLIHVEGDVAVPSDRVISLTSSKGGQISNSYKEMEHGLFTYYLLSGLRGLADTNNNGWIEVGELYTYVKDKVNQKARRKGVEQTPFLNAVKEVENIKLNRVLK
jgi:hypothetical protein